MYVNAFQATELQELHLLYKYPQYPWCIVEKGGEDREKRSLPGLPLITSERE